MKTQPIKSKTVWLNVLLIISSIGTGLLADDTFRTLVGDNIGWIGSVIGVVGVVLRIFTTKPLGKENLDVLEVTDWDEE